MILGPKMKRTPPKEIIPRPGAKAKGRGLSIGVGGWGWNIVYIMFQGRPAVVWARPFKRLDFSYVTIYIYIHVT